MVGGVRRLVVMAAMLAASMSLPASAYHSYGTEVAEVQLAARQYPEAVHTLAQLIQRGNAHAEWMLGDMFMKGQGVPLDRAEARKLWEDASNAGDSDAMLYLAWWISELGKASDSKDVMRLLKRSADLGNAKAQYFMALSYLFEAGGYKFDLQKGLQYLRSSAAQNNGDAQFWLAWFSERGIGMPKDLVLAGMYQRAATANGCARALLSLGNAYLSGAPKLQIERNAKTAAKFMSKSADLNCPGALLQLSDMYRSGNGVQVNAAKSEELLIKADKAGSASAKVTLASRYLLGASTEEDLEKATLLFRELVERRDWRGAEGLYHIAGRYLAADSEFHNNAKGLQLLEAAAAGDDVDALKTLGWSLLYGKHGALNRARGLELRERAARLSDSDAKFLLAREYLFSPLLKRKEPKRAFQLVRRASEAGDGNAECLLGFMQEVGLGTTKAPTASAKYYELGRKHGCADAEFEIGRAYQTGSGLAQDFSAARMWLLKAERDGSPHADNHLHILYELGEGVPKNIKLAMLYLRKGAKNGCPYAKRGLAEHYASGAFIPKNLAEALRLYRELAKDNIEGSAKKIAPLEKRIAAGEK